ncbi:DUF1206 domain-containing protein [Microbacterium resistens]|uniref:DUF1206 domain-containing protein n=1 Tax=Microbacterium resistens TaxID=156977 RepID=UPI0036701F15
MKTPRAAARAARRSTAFRRMARAGYVVLGLVHLMIGAIALSVAVGAGGDADQDGALEGIRRLPVGGLLLWAVAAGLVVLAVWQLVSAVVTVRDGEARTWARRAVLGGAAVAYLAIAATAAVIALGGRAESEETSQGVSAGVLSTPGGVVLLVLVGAGVFATGVGFGVAGVTRGFEKTMRLPTGRIARRITVAVGVVGYVAKGVAVAATGALFVMSALTRDPSQASGLDGALHRIAALPFGRALLWAVGAGLVAYGLFCLARARYARM